MMLKDNHIHTNYSDGLDSPELMILCAIELGYSDITILDHVRKNSNWVYGYFDEIKRLQKQFCNKINIRIGVECKVIDHYGNIDCPDDVLIDDRIEKVAAIHRIPKGNGKYISREEIKDNKEAAYRNYIDTLRGIGNNDYVKRIAHPFSLFNEFRYGDFIDWKELGSILNSLKQSIEYNVKYDNTIVPPEIWSGLKGRIVMASDSHCVGDLIRRKVLIEKFIKKEMEAN